MLTATVVAVLVGVGVSVLGTVVAVLVGVGVTVLGTVVAVLVGVGVLVGKPTARSVVPLLALYSVEAVSPL